jgi:uncharacterized protein YyaL (SSP411 family)
LVAVARERLGPRRALIALDGSPGARAWFAARAPWLARIGEKDPGPTAYVCEEFTCRAPARTPEELRAALSPAGPA